MLRFCIWKRTCSPSRTSRGSASGSSFLFDWQEPVSSSPLHKRGHLPVLVEDEDRHQNQKYGERLPKHPLRDEPYEVGPGKASCYCEHGKERQKSPLNLHLTQISREPRYGICRDH